MAYHPADRQQPMFLPSTVEDYVGPEDPVRAYDAFVDALDLQELEVGLLPRGSADEYYPKTMLKLLVYGYAYGIRSSRKLERACGHNLSFMWLMGGTKPDYRTIARFRRQHKETLKKVLKQCVKLCMKLGLIEGNALFVDGSAMRADASLKQTWTIKRCDKYIQEVNERIDRLVEESAREDGSDCHQEENLMQLKKELHSKEQLKQAIEELTQGPRSLNTTDPDSVTTFGRQGLHAGYKAQVTADQKHGLIVHSEALSQNDDFNQLNNQVKQAQDVLGIRPKTVCADAGYYSSKDLAKIDERITLIVPSRKQVHQERSGELTPFDKDNFIYDAQSNTHTCPMGKRMTYQGTDKKGRLYYRASTLDCTQCQHFGVCTVNKRGRVLVRLEHELLHQRLKAAYTSAAGRAIYNLRKQTIELIFGHFKRNLSAGQFLLRGRPGANAELSILSTCFNVRRMMTVLGGAQALVLKLKEV